MENPLGSGVFNYIALGGIIAAVTSFWGQIKSCFVSFVEMFIVHVPINNNCLQMHIRAYLINKFKWSRLGVRDFNTLYEFVRPKNKKENIVYVSLNSGLQIFWDGWKPIFVGKSKSGTETYAPSMMSLYFIRGMFNQEKLILDAVDYYNELNSSNELDVIQGFGQRRFQIITLTGGYSVKEYLDNNKDPQIKPLETTRTSFYRDVMILRWGLKDLGPRVHQDVYGKSPIDTLALSDEMREAVMDAKFWKGNQKWYQEHNVPWKMGWLLYGKPGNGKTSIVRALAEELDFPVYSFDISTMDNEDLRKVWQLAQKNSPCMIVVEDVDAAFVGRKNVANTTTLNRNLSFDCLLNCIDGVEESNGIFVIITTNYIDKVDPALGGGFVDTEIVAEKEKMETIDIMDMKNLDMKKISPRPGRIDKTIEFRNPDNKGLRKICERILKDVPEVWEETVKYGIDNDYSGAQFQFHCSQIAIKKMWEVRKNSGKKSENVINYGAVDSDKSAVRMVRVDDSLVAEDYPEAE